MQIRQQRGKDNRSAPATISGLAKAAVGPMVHSQAAIHYALKPLEWLLLYSANESYRPNPGNAFSRYLNDT